MATPAGQDLFTRKTLVVVAALCAVSLLTGLVLSLFQEELGMVRSAGNDSFSYSAVGHRGFKALLEELGYPVLTSRSRSAAKAGPRGVLILAEPQLHHVSQARSQWFLEICAQADRVLVVLPKRQGLVDPLRPGHVESVVRVSSESTRRILESLGLEGQVVQAGHSRDLVWDRGRWADRPFIAEVQLLRSDRLEPLIAGPAGTLLGRMRAPAGDRNSLEAEGEVLVLADPDLLANHGLGLGRNAEITVKIVDALRGAGGMVVFDETLHGHGVSPSMYRAFFRIPLLFVLLQVVLTVAVFLWLAQGRFGSPRPAAAAPGRGLDYLIDNTAELLEFGGHGPFVLGRYWQSAQGLVSRRLHLEPPGSGAGTGRRLANITSVRSPAFDYSRMVREVPDVARDGDAKTQDVLALARAVHRWQQEMTHGS